MKYLPLVWAAIRRKPARAILTLLSVVVAFTLFGMMIGMNATIAALHSVDWRAVGLEGYGRPENYLARQIARWTKQYRASETVPIPAMDSLIDWLPRHIPVRDASAIAHGDFRMDNLVFHPSEPRILSVAEVLDHLDRYRPELDSLMTEEFHILKDGELPPASAA